MINSEAESKQKERQGMKLTLEKQIVAVKSIIVFFQANNSPITVDHLTQVKQSLEEYKHLMDQIDEHYKTEKDDNS